MGEKLGRSEEIESTSDNTETTWDDLRKISFVQETKNSYFYTGVLLTPCGVIFRSQLGT